MKSINEQMEPVILRTEDEYEVHQFLINNQKAIRNSNSLLYKSKLYKQNGESYVLTTTASCKIGASTQLDRLLNDFEQNDFSGEYITKKTFGSDIVKIQCIYVDYVKYE